MAASRETEGTIGARMGAGTPLAPSRGNGAAPAAAPERAPTVPPLVEPPILLDQAPGAPGLAPRWTSSAKSGVGTALDGRSRVWFAVSHGIINEVYYPRVDQANTRDMGLIVTAADGFFSEEKRHTASVVELLAPGVPAYRLINSCHQGRYRIVKTVLTDPEHDVLIQHIRFEPFVGSVSDYRLYVLLAPHIGNQGYGNDAWSGDYKGVPMLYAQRADTALALACSMPFMAGSAGYVGTSDGWQELHAHGRFVRCYRRALNGNIALTGEIDLSACADAAGGATFVLTLGFGRSPAEAGQRARLALLRPFAEVAEEYVEGWRAFHGQCLDLQPSSAASDLYHVSASVLKMHENKLAPGGIIASLSIPWGQSKGDHEMGGYHLIWPRDLVESAGGLFAAGHAASACRTLRYLMTTQEADGHWPQNMWLDGTAYWTGVQLDETAFPILLADMLRRGGALDGTDPWPMVRRAAGYLVRTGPVTQQDRWEEDGGYSPFTLAVVIAALLAAADFADLAGEPWVSAYLRDTADAWNDNIERWTYVLDTDLSRTAGVDGYYARIAPPDVAEAHAPSAGYVPIKNRPPGTDRIAYSALVSPDALALVRFGLRAANDPHIVNTVQVIDTILRRETPTGPIWYRYNGDGYGEHADGAPFDGTGIGRGWPLLAGERAHYELARGNVKLARELLDVMGRQASDGGLIPEQVWDAPDVPARELYTGRPSGSAMPLVWAHAEYVKLARSLYDGAVFDAPPQTLERYVRQGPRTARVALWCLNNKVRAMVAGQTLRIQTTEPAVVRWSADDWQAFRDTETADAGLGVLAAHLDTGALPPGTVVRFTLYWPVTDQWQGEDFAVSVTAATGSITAEMAVLPESRDLDLVGERDADASR
ncbi:MAG TPA: glucan 1,4-alpha-glucosidase [Gemmatimonadaceae bacterium]|nr:glucan 1,4-alpha-glucosidase [Gemmatimonadaceae bacterium]